MKVVIFLFPHFCHLCVFVALHPTPLRGKYVIAHPIDCLFLILCSIHILSFIFSNHLVLIKVTVNSNHILGTVGMRQEYTLNRIPIHYSAPCTRTFAHSFTPRGNLALPIHLLTVMNKAGEARTDIERTCKTLPRK